MNRILRSGSAAFAIQSGFEPSVAGVAVDLPDVLSALGFLARFQGDPHSVDVLRDMAASEASPTGLDDHEILEALAFRISRGQLRVIELPSPPLLAFGDADEAPAPAPEGRGFKDWVEIVLVDEEDNPVTGAEYEITLPDGSTLTGQTGVTGRIRLTDIDPGMCAFSFTKLDERVWRPA